MLDGATYKVLKNCVPLKDTLCIGYPEVHWSCPREYGIQDGVRLLSNLGATGVCTLDLNGKCDYQQDLNRIWNTSIPHFDSILDVGTIEHIANPLRALKEYLNHTHVGGQIVISTVCNNLPGHGFWQLTPQFLYEFFRVNGCVVDVYTYNLLTFRLKRFIPTTKQHWTLNIMPQLLVCRAIKHTNVELAFPQQTFWSTPYAQHSKLRQLIRRMAQRLLSRLNAR